jgi:hypothetical protein
MRLRTRLILSLCFLALIAVSSVGGGRPWLRALAFALFSGVILIQMSERRIRGTSERTTLNIPR